MENLQSATWGGSLISMMSNKVKAEGGINLAQGIPGFDPPFGLKRALEEANQGPFHQYPPAEGHQGLRNFLESKFKQKGLDKHLFIITQGATEALSLIYTYLWNLRQGILSTLVIDPAYESFIHLPSIFGQPLNLHIPQDSHTLNFDILEKEIVQNKVQLIMIASPGNPLGISLQRKDWRRLFAITEKYRIFLVADLVYDPLYFSSPQELPLDEAHKNVFIVDSFSKQFSITGWRIGALGCHPDHFIGIKNVHDYTGLCAPSLLQEALFQFIENHSEEAHTYIENTRQLLANNYQQASHELTLAGFEVSSASGGYFIWAKLPWLNGKGLEFALGLYENTRVAVVPGLHFSPHAGNFIRINIARPPDELKEGLARIREYVTNQRHGKH
ncbi:MAG: pyridoxal phosphate-dependent aminotransferase [Bacteroidales bacterium]